MDGSSPKSATINPQPYCDCVTIDSQVAVLPPWVALTSLAESHWFGCDQHNQRDYRDRQNSRRDRPAGLSSSAAAGGEAPAARAPASCVDFVLEAGGIVARDHEAMGLDGRGCLEDDAGMARRRPHPLVGGEARDLLPLQGGPDGAVGLADRHARSVHDKRQAGDRHAARRSRPSRDRRRTRRGGDRAGGRWRVRVLGLVHRHLSAHLDLGLPARGFDPVVMTMTVHAPRSTTRIGRPARGSDGPWRGAWSRNSATKSVEIATNSWTREGRPVN